MRLIYTALSRAKYKLYILGPKNIKITRPGAYNCGFSLVSKTASKKEFIFLKNYDDYERMPQIQWRYSAKFKKRYTACTPAAKRICNAKNIQYRLG